MKPINVLSLFDGMSCGRIALDRCGIPVKNYFASEVDKYAIKVAKANYPNTIHIGDVCDVMWPETFEGIKIDLLIGGSPCQGFSFAGKQLNFDDPRSKLFWEFVRLLKECNPKYFLLENVKMRRECMDVITETLGVEPIFINSSLVSAQSRQRYYWTNITSVTQPKDKGIMLKDILEDGDAVVDAIYKSRPPRLYTKKPPTIRASRQGLDVVTANVGCKQIGIADDINGYDMTKRIYSIEGKSPALTTMQGGHREPKIAIDDLHWRKLSVLECERLQTVPDGYTDYVSNTQRYKMLGNGWTVDVVAHIFDSMKGAI